MGDNDGKTVTPEVSTGTPAPAAPEPSIEDKIAAAVQEALKKQEPEIARRIQSEADKRVAPIQRRLSEAERRAQILEGTLTTLPNTLGDVDPEVRQRVRLATLEGQVGHYRSRDQEADAMRRMEEAKQAVVKDTREEIEALGIDPNDPDLVLDLDAPDPVTFRRKAFASVNQIQKRERAKEKADLDAKLAKHAADIEAKLRKESGVDKHEDAGAAPGGKPTFTRAQFKDRKFYVANREAMDLAAKEGRVQ